MLLVPAPSQSQVIRRPQSSTTTELQKSPEISTWPWANSHGSLYRHICLRTTFNRRQPQGLLEGLFGTDRLDRSVCPRKIVPCQEHFQVALGLPGVVLRPAAFPLNQALPGTLPRLARIQDLLHLISWLSINQHCGWRRLVSTIVRIWLKQTHMKHIMYPEMIWQFQSSRL